MVYVPQKTMMQHSSLTFVVKILEKNSMSKDFKFNKTSHLQQVILLQIARGILRTLSNISDGALCKNC